MSQKWNLQDIRPAGNSRNRRKPASQPASGYQSSEAQDSEAAPSRRRARTETASTAGDIVITDGRRKDKRRVITAIVVSGFIIVGASVLSTLMGKTEITINPEHRTPTISADFTASSNPQSDGLLYDVMTLEETAESQVQASGQIDVEENAVGTIEIRKSTPGAERLIPRTRFRTPNGLVYRIPEAVVVPGAIEREGELVPGTIRTTAQADAVGETYNISSGTPFDLPAFEENGNTALFEAFSAVAVSDFTGGFAGSEFQIDGTELETAQQALQLELRDELLGRIDEIRPAGTVAFPGSVAITYTSLPTVEYGEGLVTIREQITMQLPVFRNQDLGTFLAEQSIATYSGGSVRIDNPEALEFTYTTATTSNTNIADLEVLSFSLLGQPTLIWEYDGDALRQDLAGLPRTALGNAIAAYSGIEGATAHMTPFWKRTFPENPDEMKIIEELRDPNIE
jgi:hypothetical protein